MLRKLTSLFLLICLTFSLTNCTSLRHIPREELAGLQTKETMVVTLTNGRQLEIKEPRIEGSQLVGYVEPEGYRTIELIHVESAAIKELDKKKTIGLAAWGLVAAVVAVTLMTREDGPEPCPT